MKHSDFKMNTTFRCGGHNWKVTDIGTRTIIAICLDHDHVESWQNGPPYALAEMVFDENDIGGCEV